MKVGVIQLCSAIDPLENMKTIRRFLEEAKGKGINHIFLPECFYSLSDGQSATPFLVEKGNQHYQAISNLARDFQVFLLGGSAATLIDGKIYNRSYNFSPKGEELVHYDKVHLFSCDLRNVKDANEGPSDQQGKKVLDEGRIFTAGTEGRILELEGFKIGLGICFDLRFPEMFREYSRQGANVISLPSAFTVPTGKAHWHVLMRARAIENQSYVIAAAQWGKNNSKIATFGHSLIIDPWGTVIADAGEGEKLIEATLDLSLISNVRKRMNVIL